MLKRFLMGGAVVAPLLAAAIGHTAELPIAGAYGSTTVCEIYRAADADAVFHDGMDPKTGEIVLFTSSDDDLPFALFLPDRLVGVEQDCQFLDVRGEKVTILCEYEWGTGNEYTATIREDRVARTLTYIPADANDGGTSIFKRCQPEASTGYVAENPVFAANLGNRVALVIGNSTYRSVPFLPNPSNDADLTASALRSTGFSDVTVVKDLDRDSLADALKIFQRKADDADWAVIYYAGHGIEVDGDNFLIPVDAALKDARDIEDEAISLDRLLRSIEGADKLRLVVLDACRDNPFEQQMQVAGLTRSIGRGLARVEPTGATLVVYAAKEGTTSIDGDGANSSFAVSFAKRVIQPGIEINKVFRFVRDDVMQATENVQQPFVYGSLPPDDFFFVPPG